MSVVVSLHVLDERRTRLSTVPSIFKLDTRCRVLRNLTRTWSRSPDRAGNSCSSLGTLRVSISRVVEYALGTRRWSRTMYLQWR
jgi:hypothetical protein